MPRAKTLPPLSDAQVEIMQVVWERGEVAVSEVREAIVERRPIARNTVLTVMDRLEKRGWLSKRSIGNLHVYRAAVSQQATLGDVVRRMVDTVFGGSADALVMALIEGRGVSQEAKRIRKMIDETRSRPE